MMPEDKNWKYTNKFNTLAEAKAYLNGKAGITAESGTNG